MTTGAPTGETPVSRCKLTRDHLSVISAISPEGQLYLTMPEQAFDCDAVVAFLKHLLEDIKGQLLIIWAGAPIHRSQTIKPFLAAQAAARLWLARLPAYAPDLNPAEGIGHDLKHVELQECLLRCLGRPAAEIDDGDRKAAPVTQRSAKPALSRSRNY